MEKRWPQRSTEADFHRDLRCSFVTIALMLFIGFTAQAPVVEAASPPRYVSIPATPDGIGKAYMGREIAQVMGAGGAPALRARCMPWRYSRE